jgi:diguanylate cyclase (GGDEF)-like protein
MKGVRPFLGTSGTRRTDVVMMSDPTGRISEGSSPDPELSEITAVQYARELGALHEATAALLTTLDLENLLGKILDAATSAIPASEKGAILLLAPDTGQLEIRAVLGYTETDPRIHKLPRAQMTTNIDRVINQREPLLVRPADNDSDSRYTIIAPLILEETVLGALSLEAAEKEVFTNQDLRLLASFAVTATAAIRNAQLHAEVQRQAITDELTGLYNRRGLTELGEREVERAWRYGRNLSAMMIDIDDLKSINDTYGHAGGDRAIIYIAQVCSSNTRKIDVVCRFGGDEFVILLPENDLFIAAKVAERLLHNITQDAFYLDGQVVQLSVSMGISKVSKDTKDLEALLKSADEALYEAKSSGKDQIVIK